MSTKERLNVNLDKELKKQTAEQIMGQNWRGDLDKIEGEWE